MADTNAEKSVKFIEGGVESDCEEYGTESDDKLSRQFNKFQLLEMVENPETIEADDCNDDDDDDDDDSHDNRSQKQQSTSNNTTTSIKSKRNRRRNNKGKSSKKKNPEFDLDYQISSGSMNQSSENIIRQQDKADQGERNSHLNLLKLDMKNLIPENELKRMFGKSVLKEDKTKDSKTGRHLFAAGWAVHQRSRFSTSAIFESRIAHVGTGPKMELDELFNRDLTTKVENNNDIKKQSSAIQANLPEKKPIYFKFVHEKSYQTAHNMFLDAAERADDEGIIANLNTYPVHVESLIQVSDIYKDHGEDIKTASDLVERALLIFEQGFHHKFNLGPGNSRLSYRRPENRSFFITLFKHIIYTNRRGLRRTPLEYTKLLLSLDPENDPLFATLLIDFYAIRSEEHDYLIEFISSWQHLSKLPNMNLSLALAYFMKSRNLKRGKTDSEANLKLADECLQKALIRYPNFIIPLLDACSGEPNAELQKCDYFNYSVYSNKYKTVPESIDLLISLYVHRTLVLWKTKDVLSWLERNIAILVNKFATRELFDEGQQIEYWSSFRGPSPRNLLRHIVLSDLKVKVPPSATTSSILDIDPYPPESIVSYARDNRSSPANHTMDINSTSFSLFLRSMLPNFSVGENSSDRNQPTNR